MPSKKGSSNQPSLFDVIEPKQKTLAELSRQELLLEQIRKDCEALNDPLDPLDDWWRAFYEDRLAHFRACYQELIGHSLNLSS